MKKKIFLLVFVLTCFTVAQSKLSFGFGGGLQFPSGLFGDYYGSGFNGEGSLDYSLSSNFDVGLSIGYMSHSYSVENANVKIKELLKDDAFEINDFDSKFGAVPLKLSGKYYFTPSGFRPFALIEFGINFISQDTVKSATMTSGNPDKVTVNSVETASETKTGFAIGLGFLIPLTPSTNLDITAKYSFISHDIKEEYNLPGTEIKNSESISFFVIRAGVRFNL